MSVSKWRLDNGLEVVLLPDPQATAVSYTTWFRVGSRNEDATAGETGLAHLFEHLMFTQTKNAPPNAFDTQMEAVGGSSNAMTYYDFTAYVDDVPPAEVATAVRLEADRMVNLDLRKKQVETERDVVAEERLSSVEDSVDGILDELMYQQAFKKHPYRWPVIGLMKDIKAFTQANAVGLLPEVLRPEQRRHRRGRQDRRSRDAGHDRGRATGRWRRRRSCQAATPRLNGRPPPRSAPPSPAPCPPTGW